MYNKIMSMFSRVGDFFGLDIGTRSIRIVQLAPRDNKDGAGSFILKNYAYLPIDPKVSADDSDLGNKKLGEAILNAIGQSSIKTKNVVLSLPSSKAFTTIIDMPDQTDVELTKTIKYQVDQYIPMAVEDAKFDWAVLGQSPRDPSKKEVILSSTSIEYSERQLEFLEDLGLNVIAMEPDQIAISRSLNMELEGAVNMIVDLGETTTELTIVYQGAPRLVRSIPIGFNTIIQSAVRGLDIKEDQARQFILKFGLATDKLEGKVFNAIQSVLENFTGELNKSLKFFQTRYPQIPVNQIIVSGYAAMTPMMNQYIANYTNVKTVIGSPWNDVVLTPDQQTSLMSIGAEFAVAVGLAQRGNNL